jgi:hypothetical protein
VYLLVAYLNFKAKLVSSMQQIIRVLQLNIFTKRNLIELFKPTIVQRAVSPQISLWETLQDSSDVKLRNELHHFHR